MSFLNYNLQQIIIIQKRRHKHVVKLFMGKKVEWFLYPLPNGVFLNNKAQRSNTKISDKYIFVIKPFIKEAVGQNNRLLTPVSLWVDRLVGKFGIFRVGPRV